MLAINRKCYLCGKLWINPFYLKFAISEKKWKKLTARIFYINQRNNNKRNFLHIYIFHLLFNFGVCGFWKLWIQRNWWINFFFEKRRKTIFLLLIRENMYTHVNRNWKLATPFSIGHHISQNFGNGYWYVGFLNYLFIFFPYYLTKNQNEESFHVVFFLCCSSIRFYL